MTAENEENSLEYLDKYFKENPVELVLFPSNSSIIFSRLDHLSEFVNKEAQFWADIKRDINGSVIREHPIMKISTHFKNLNRDFSQISSPESFNFDLKTTLNKAKTSINNLSKKVFPNIFSGSDFGVLLKEMVKDNCTLKEIDGFFVGYLGNSIFNSNLSSQIVNQEFYLGFVKGVRLSRPSEFNIVDNHFLSDVDSLLKTVNDKYGEFNSKIEIRTADLELKFDELRRENNEIVTNAQSKFDSLLENKKKELLDLESLYNEKLILSEPAENWKNAYKAYHKRGKCWAWVAAATGFIVAAVLVLILFAVNVENDWMKLESIKFTIILTIIISIGFLLLNLFIRLSLSNFHLSKDAYERSKLTYFYLSLRNRVGSEEFTEKERSIVFQALFARSDSGLTKSDSGVQMPNTNQLLELHKKP